MTLQLTKAEAQIMHIIWPLTKATVRQVLEQMPAPLPHYNTVSTLMKILEEKGFLETEKIGNTHLFHPLVSKEKYTEKSANKLLNNFFDGSIENMLTFFVKKKDISIQELDKIVQQLKK